LEAARRALEAGDLAGALGRLSPLPPAARAALGAWACADVAVLTDVTLADLFGVTPVPGVPDTFTGPSFEYGPLRVYGGHFIGQALAAAFGTRGRGRGQHSDERTADALACQTRVAA
jgi:hypothetical protein